MHFFGLGVRTRWVAWLLIGGLAALGLHACGGGGVGTNGTGIAPSGTGTVTGFGSVFVDGVRYDDSQIVARRLDASGASAETEIRLGQRVDLSYQSDSTGTLTLAAAEVAPAIVAPVQQVSTDGLTVLGQTVLVQADPSSGPVTTFDGGYALLADVTVGDWVEVHAVAPAGAASSWLATRIEKIDAAPTVRLAGRLSGVQAVAGQWRFQLGSLSVRTGADTVWSGGTTPTDGQAVIVLAAPAGFDPAAATLAASRVVLQQRSASSVADSRLAGWIRSVAGDGQSFELDGVRVSLSATDLAVVGGSRADLSAGRYVLVLGRYLGDDEHLQARRIELPYAAGQSAESMELHGTVLDWTATTRRFRLRDVVVDASLLAPGAAKLENDGCSAFTDLADGQYVEIKGYGTGSGVQATRITCKQDDSSQVSGEVVELRGTLSAVTTSRFTLQTSEGEVQVGWSDAGSYFRSPLSADGLASYVGSTLQIEGRFTGSGSSRVLMASKIKLKSGGD